MTLKSEAQLVPGFTLSPPTPWPDPGSLTSSTPSKFLFPEESGGKKPSRTQIPQGTQGRSCSHAAPPEQMGPREEQARSGSATAAASRSGGGEDRTVDDPLGPWPTPRAL